MTQPPARKTVQRLRGAISTLKRTGKAIGKLKHRVSALNLLVSALTRTASHDEPPERSPFKKAAATAP